MTANLTFEALKDAASRGEIDTVLVCLIDMQGRLMGINTAILTRSGG